MRQIRFLGLGGQGVVTGAKLFSEAVVSEGKYAQTTPAYGHERRGAPVSADVFSDDQPIRPKCFVFEPDIVVLFGTGVLAHGVDVTKNTHPDTLFIVNTAGVNAPYPSRDTRCLASMLWVLPWRPPATRCPTRPCWAPWPPRVWSISMP